MTRRKVISVIGTPIDALGWDEVCSQMHAWSSMQSSRVICICNSHSLATAGSDEDLHDALANADMNTPDGAPVALMMRLQGIAGQQRINGPDLMWRYCEDAGKRGEGIFLYGSTPSTLQALQKKLLAANPSLRICGAYSPPFGPLSREQDEQIVDMINASGATVVWVGLGCPKQEKWMAAHRGRINAVMVGVGAAFDYHAGLVRRAPLWMQNCGLEWLFRLVCEPRRLWKRYLTTNSIFLLRASLQLLRAGFVRS